MNERNIKLTDLGRGLKLEDLNIKNPIVVPNSEFRELLVSEKPSMSATSRQLPSLGSKSQDCRYAPTMWRIITSSIGGRGYCPLSTSGDIGSIFSCSVKRARRGFTSACAPTAPTTPPEMPLSRSLRNWPPATSRAGRSTDGEVSHLLENPHC